MSISIPNITLHRFAIAKEMYLQGTLYINKESRVGLISAIMNFDYAVETILKAIALDKDISLYHKKSGFFKTFPELAKEIQDLKPYSNAIVNQINALHKLRNDVQHDAVIPSSAEVNRHQQTTRLFIEDICANFYNNSITFDSISLSYLVESQIEKIILDEMEKAMVQTNYKDAINYARKAVNYHVRLLKRQMELPDILLQDLDNYWEITTAIKDIQRSNRYVAINPGDRYFRGVKKTIEWIIDRIVLPEYNVEIKELLGSYSSFPFPSEFDIEKADRARMLAYGIITGSQWQLKKSKDSDLPVIFDCEVINKDGKNLLKLGIACIRDISDVMLTFIYPNKQRKEIHVQGKTGIQHIPIDKSHSNIELIGKVKDGHGKEGYFRIVINSSSVPP
jgi:hypothetical protein